MRLTGGVFAGRVLETPKGPKIRPTQDRVRAALFDILGERVVGARVLDLFAGSGAMGLEALSRGAAAVTFVDQSGFCVQIIRRNLKNLMGPGTKEPYRGLTPRSRDRACPVPLEFGVRPQVTVVLQMDAISAIRKLAREGALFDLVILDPPYGMDLARKTLNALGRCAIVSPTGWVITEHDKRDSLPAEIEEKSRRLMSQRIEQYGDTALTFFA